MNDAAKEWTTQSGFAFEISGNNPACDDAGTLLNGADFFTSACNGTLLGPATVAITETISSGGETIATGITFNSRLNWGLYDTPLRPGEMDFRRVALHELGHVAALGHEDRFESIMSSRIDNTVALQPDDVAGIKARYPELAAADPPIPNDTVPTAARCSRDLKAVGSLCKALFACLATNANHPNVGTRIGCTAGAEASFVSKNGCTDLADSVMNRVFATDEAIAAGIDRTDKDHRKLHSKVLKQGGKQCSKALKAEAKNVSKPNVSKLNTKRSKARFTFIRKGNKAVAKGEKRGNPYNGPSVTEIANQIDALVDETVDKGTP